MPVSKPSSLPRWAETAGGTPAGNITEPVSGQKDTGWTVDQVPPSSYQNWWQQLVYKWVQWLDDLTNQVLTWAAAQTFAALVSLQAGVRGNDGSSSVPTYSWTNDPDTGLYRAGAQDYRFVVDGQEQARFTNGGARFTNGINMNGARIANLDDGVTVDEAVNLGQLEARSKTLIYFGNVLLSAAPSTGYLHPGFDASNAAGTTERVITMPFPGTAARLYIEVISPNSSVTYTVRKNGVDTAITTSGVGDCTDLSNSVSFAAGDKFSIKAVLASGTGPADIQASLQITPG